MIVTFRCIDLETSGLLPEHEVIEIAFTDLIFDTETKASQIGQRGHSLHRPTKPMPSDVIAVHHLTNEMLAGYPVCTFEDRMALATDGEPSFLVAANAAFEQQWVPTPEGVRWICTVKAAARIYPDAPSASNQAMRYELGLDIPPNLGLPPHRAEPDCFVTACVLAEFLKTERVRDLVQWTLEPRWMGTCPLGKHRGTPWASVDHGFLSWMLRTPDLDPDAVHWARLELQRRQEISP